MPPQYRMPSPFVQKFSSSASLPQHRFPTRGDFLDSFHGFAQVLLGIGVAETDVAIAVLAEGSSIEPGDTGLIQQVVGEFARAHPGGGHVGKGVERAEWQSAVEPWNPV